MKGEIADVVKYLSLGLFGTACKIMMSTPELSPIYTELLIKEIDNELEEFAKNGTIVFYDKLMQRSWWIFKWKSSFKKLSKQIPLLNQTLHSICCSNNKKRAPDALVNPNVKATITAAILHQRCPEMSALAYRTGLLLRHTGAGGLVCSD